MARPATPDVRITEALQPRATMVQPGTAQPGGMERSPLHAVASALSSLSSDLAAWGQKEQEKEKEEAAIRGEAAFWQGNQEGAAEATRRGTIPPNASPYFMRGYQRAAGSTAGFNLETEVNAAYDQWEGKSLTGNADPRQFDAWFHSTVKERVKNEDPSFLRGLMPHLREIQNKTHGRWQADVRNNTLYKAESNYGALAGSTIDEYAKQGIASATGTDVEKLGSTLDAIRDSAYKSGMRQENIDKVMVDAIAAKALSNRDPSLLSLFDRGSVTGSKLGDTPYGRDQKDKAYEALRTLSRQQTSEERSQADRRDRLDANQARATIVEQLLKDPNAVVDDGLITRVEKVDGDFKLNILNWRKQVREGNTAEDPAAISEVYDKIINGGDITVVTDAMSKGIIRQPSTVSSALSFLKSAQDYQQSDSKILDTVAAKNYAKEIETRAQEGKLSVNGILGQTSMTPVGRAALNSFRRDLMEWQMQNPKASALEREDFITKRGDVALKSLERKGPAASAAPSPTAPQTPAPQSPPSAAPAPGDQRQGTQGDYRQRAQQLGLTPERIEMLEGQARARGVSPDSLLQRLQEMRGRRSSIELPGGGSIQVTGLDEAGVESLRQMVAGQRFGGGPRPTIQQAAFSPDTPMPSGAGGTVGGLISSGEGGYNSYNRGTAGDSGGREIDFSKVTIGDIMRGQAGHPSSRQFFAVGKYQIIPSTMKAAVEKLGLSPDTKFTPEVQELIFRNYLIADKRPAIMAYITGKSEDLGAAQLAAAQEFASVADPSTGRSHYAGSGGNASSISANRMGQALQRERQQYQENIKAGMSPQEAWRALSKDSSLKA